MIKQYDLTKNAGVSLLRSSGVSLLWSSGVYFNRSSGVSLSGISSLTKEAEENKKKIKATYQDIEHKLERLEERYVTEELKQDLYVKYVEKYKQEKVGILKELQKLESKCSNHEEVIDLALENAVNFTKMWSSGGWKRKVRLQYLLFPKGLNYNKRNDTVRTENINQAFL